MVLAELGQKLTGALKKLQNATVVDEEVLKKVLNEITIALLQSDVNLKFVKRLKDNITMQFNTNEQTGNALRKLILQSVAKELTEMLSTERKPFEPKKGRPNVVMFVGLQGSGKTTTCTKFASYWQRKNFRTCLVCADTFRAGAFDQLKQNATKVRVPFHGSYTEMDPVAIAKEGVTQFKKEGFEMIIVDTSGRHKQEADLFEEMQQVEKAVNPDEIIFVMDSSIGQACYDQALAFKKAVRVGSVIITKLDGHAKGGGALSAVAATESPIIFIGTGEHFNDLEKFEAESFVNRLLGLGDLKKLFDTIKEIIPEDQQEAFMQKIATGNFRLKDLQTQYNSILNIGPLSQFMSLIPGMSNMMGGQVNDKEGVKKIKRYLTIMDSMKMQELETEQVFTEARIKAIARGSGTSMVEIQMLLEEYKNIKGMVGNLSKLGAGGKAGNMDMNALMKNPAQLMQKLGGALNPQMINSLGGMENIMNMMKQFGSMEKNGQMGGIGDMLKGMGGMPGMGALPGMGGMPKRR